MNGASQPLMLQIRPTEGTNQISPSIFDQLAILEGLLLLQLKKKPTQ